MGPASASHGHEGVSGEAGGYPGICGICRASECGGLSKAEESGALEEEFGEGLPLTEPHLLN